MVNVFTTLESYRRSSSQLGVFSTAPAIKNYFANFLSEIIGTMALTLEFYLSGLIKLLMV